MGDSNDMELVDDMILHVFAPKDDRIKREDFVSLERWAVYKFEREYKNLDIQILKNKVRDMEKEIAETNTKWTVAMFVFYVIIVFIDIFTR